MMVKRIAVLGLVWFVAAAAHAQPAPSQSKPQAQGPGGPLSSRAGLGSPRVQGPGLPKAAATDTPCLLVTKVSDQYVESPLIGFEPAVASSPMPKVQADSGAVLVLCNRASLMPEVSDYRVLTEMRLPLAIKSGAKTLFVGVKDGRVQLALPEGDATPDEMAALRTRQDEMQTAMTGKTAAK